MCKNQNKINLIYDYYLILHIFVHIEIYHLVVKNLLKKLSLKSIFLNTNDEKKVQLITVYYFCTKWRILTFGLFTKQGLYNQLTKSKHF